MPIEKDKQILNDALMAYEKSKTRASTDLQSSVWRIIMKSKITKFAAAATIVIAAVLTINIFNKSIPTASAAQLLQDAIEAVSDIRSVHIKARMRTLPQDNFASIELDYDFVPLEMWKQTDSAGILRWRIEKPLRVAVMDGNQATMLIRNNSAGRGSCPNFQCFDLYWCGQLLNVEGLLESELKNAQQSKNTEISLRHETLDGRELLVLDVDKPAQSDFTGTSDYLKNKFLSESDRTETYYFDPQTKLLTGFEINVHTKDKDILVFEATDIEYNAAFDAKLFNLVLPKDVVWYIEPQTLPEKYQQMGPKATAAAFFDACAKEDWNAFLKFWSATAVDEKLKSYLGGLEVMSLGEPFKSGLYHGWFVPYEIKMKDGTVRKHNLAVRNDNPAKRYVVDGGI
jgi:outer membrane lipoprotein-sorting protein